MAFPVLFIFVHHFTIFVLGVVASGAGYPGNKKVLLYLTICVHILLFC